MPEPTPESRHALDAEPGADGNAPEPDRALSEAPDETDLVMEAPTAAYADGVVATAGGVAGAGATPPISTGYRKKRAGVVFWVSVAWLVLIVLLAVLYPLLPLEDPTRAQFRPRLGPLEEGRLLGTDSLGRDMFARVIVGARVSLAVGFMSIIFGLVVGGFIGVVSGYFRGKLEAILMSLMDAMLAFPALVLGLAIITFVAHNNANIWHVTFTIGILSIPSISRIIRASTLAFAQREFVLAARTVGAKDWRIIRREILPNVLPPALSFSLIAVAVAIVAEGALAFLGLSVRPPTPTWGGMINEGRQVLRDASHVSMIPSIVMLLTVLALNYAGDALSARFQFREGSL
jgi:peptide/nickel transport system permease protein